MLPEACQVYHTEMQKDFTVYIYFSLSPSISHILLIHRSTWTTRPTQNRNLSRSSTNDAKRVCSTSLPGTTSTFWQATVKPALAADGEHKEHRELILSTNNRQCGHREPFVRHVQSKLVGILVNQLRWLAQVGYLRVNGEW